MKIKLIYTLALCFCYFSMIAKGDDLPKIEDQPDFKKSLRTLFERAKASMNQPQEYLLDMGTVSTLAPTDLKDIAVNGAISMLDQPTKDGIVAKLDAFNAPTVGSTVGGWGGRNGTKMFAFTGKILLGYNDVRENDFVVNANTKDAEIMSALAAGLTIGDPTTPITTKTFIQTIDDEWKTFKTTNGTNKTMVCFFVEAVLIRTAKTGSNVTRNDTYKPGNEINKSYFVLVWEDGLEALDWYKVNNDEAKTLLKMTYDQQNGFTQKSEFPAFIQKIHDLLGANLVLDTPEKVVKFVKKTYETNKTFLNTLPVARRKDYLKVLESGCLTDNYLTNIGGGITYESAVNALLETTPHGDEDAILNYLDTEPANYNASIVCNADGYGRTLLRSFMARLELANFDGFVTNITKLVAQSTTVLNKYKTEYTSEAKFNKRFYLIPVENFQQTYLPWLNKIELNTAIDDRKALLGIGATMTIEDYNDNRVDEIIREPLTIHHPYSIIKVQNMTNKAGIFDDIKYNATGESDYWTALQLYHYAYRNRQITVLKKIRILADAIIIATGTGTIGAALADGDGIMAAFEIMQVVGSASNIGIESGALDGVPGVKNAALAFKEIADDANIARFSAVGIYKGKQIFDKCINAATTGQIARTINIAKNSKFLLLYRLAKKNNTGANTAKVEAALKAMGKYEEYLLRKGITASQTNSVIDNFTSATKESGLGLPSAPGTATIANPRVQGIEINLPGSAPGAGNGGGFVEFDFGGSGGGVNALAVKPPSGTTTVNNLTSTEQSIVFQSGGTIMRDAKSEYIAPIEDCGQVRYLANGTTNTLKTYTQAQLQALPLGNVKKVTLPNGETSAYLEPADLSAPIPIVNNEKAVQRILKEDAKKKAQDQCTVCKANDDAIVCKQAELLSTKTGKTSEIETICTKMKTANPRLANIYLKLNSTTFTAAEASQFLIDAAITAPPTDPDHLANVSQLKLLTDLQMDSWQNLYSTHKGTTKAKYARVDTKALTKWKFLNSTAKDNITNFSDNAPSGTTLPTLKKFTGYLDANDQGTENDNFNLFINSNPDVTEAFVGHKLLAEGRDKPFYTTFYDFFQEKVSQLPLQSNVYDKAKYWLDYSEESANRGSYFKQGKDWEEYVGTQLKTRDTDYYKKIKKAFDENNIPITDLDQRSIYTQVRFCINGNKVCEGKGDYFIADFVFAKETNEIDPITNLKKVNIIIADTKLTAGTDFTPNQNTARGLGEYFIWVTGNRILGPAVNGIEKSLKVYRDTSIDFWKIYRGPSEETWGGIIKP